MKLIGILGGIASGKSLVSEQLRQLGAAVLDADQAGHQVLRLPEVKQAARARWGASIVAADGEIDRKALAAIVFGPTEQAQAELEFLERLTHPLIRQRLIEQLNLFEAQGVKVAVLDAPVMLKAGWHELCDKLLFVDVPREIRVERAKTRGWSEAEFTARELRQEPVERKRAMADFTVDNSRTLEYTRRQIEQFWTTMIG